MQILLHSKWYLSFSLFLTSLELPGSFWKHFSFISNGLTEKSFQILNWIRKVSQHSFMCTIRLDEIMICKSKVSYLIFKVFRLDSIRIKHFYQTTTNKDLKRGERVGCLPEEMFNATVGISESKSLDVSQRSARLGKPNFHFPPCFNRPPSHRRDSQLSLKHSWVELR